MLRLSRFSPLLLLAAAALVALTVFFAPAGTEPAQAQTAEVEHWSADLTVGNLPPNLWRGYTSVLNKGMLSDNDFVYESVTYVISNLTDRGNGDVLLELNKPITASMKAALTLRIRGRELPLADAVAPHPNILRWENTGWRFSLNDVVAVKLITPATTAPPLPPVDLTGTRKVWYATLAAESASSGETGYVSNGFQGTLSDTNITYAGADYVVEDLFVDPEVGSGRLSFGFTSNPTSLKSAMPALTLNVGNTLSDIRQFALSDATVNGNDLRWTNTGLSWAEGDTVRVWLTVKLSELNLPTLTASISGDPREGGSPVDLWSATLTVQDLAKDPNTHPSAPANRGCDDSQTGAHCSSALTDNDFTFNGVEYTVKGISSNKRKVIQDRNNPFRIHKYPESIKLTLDKTIPESLHSCLTLDVDGRQIPLARGKLSRSKTNDVVNDTLTLTEISGVGWGLNWSAGGTVQLKLPDDACLILTLSEPVTEETSMQWRIGGTTDNYIPHPNPYATLPASSGTAVDYEFIKLPTFAAGSTSASTPIKPVDDNAIEGCETLILAMTMWPGYRAVTERFTAYIEDNDGGTPCVILKAQQGVPGLRVTEAPTDYVVPGYSKPDGSPGSVGDDKTGALPTESSNSAPTVAAPLADMFEPAVGGGKEIDLSNVFADPDGDALTYSASTTNEDISVGYIDGTRLLVLALSRGTATITVTADDGNGGLVSDSFTVTVKEAPTVANPIADISSLEAGASKKISLSGVFADADGDALTLSAESSDTDVATATVSSGSLTVTAQQAGTATITVTAQDSDGNQISDTFDVTVNAAQQQQQQKTNSAPTVARAIADATIVNESGTHQVSLSGVFDDADGDNLTVTADSSDETVATVAVSADYSTLTVTAKARGTATVTATADDGNGGTVDDTFTVTVKAAPVVASAITDVSDLEVEANRNVGLSGVFSDADGDALTLSAASSDTAVAMVAVATDGTNLTVTGVAEGTATITVTAHDSDGNSVSDTFDITVTVEPEEQDAVARYDANQDGVISRTEYFAAVADLSTGKVTINELVQIRQAWVDGGFQQ